MTKLARSFGRDGSIASSTVTSTGPGVSSKPGGTAAVRSRLCPKPVRRARPFQKNRIAACQAGAENHESRLAALEALEHFARAALFGHENAQAPIRLASNARDAPRGDLGRRLVAAPGDENAAEVRRRRPRARPQSARPIRISPGARLASGASPVAVAFVWSAAGEDAKGR